MLFHDQCRIIHRRIVAIGQDHNRFVAIAGFTQQGAGALLIIDVISLLAGIRVARLVGILKTNIQPIIIIGRCIHDVFHIHRSLHVAAEGKVIGWRL